jgi:hypothetical protein
MADALVNETARFAARTGEGAVAEQLIPRIPLGEWLYIMQARRADTHGVC